MDNLFSQGMSDANLAFAKDCGEEFEIISGARAGKCMAVSIDDLDAETVAAAGGHISDTMVNIFILKSLRAEVQLVEGAKLRVRGKSVRVGKIKDDGDNTEMMLCATSGVQL